MLYVCLYVCMYVCSLITRERLDGSGSNFPRVLISVPEVLSARFRSDPTSGSARNELFRTIFRLWHARPRPQILQAYYFSPRNCLPLGLEAIRRVTVPEKKFFERFSASAFGAGAIFWPLFTGPVLNSAVNKKKK